MCFIHGRGKSGACRARRRGPEGGVWWRVARTLAASALALASLCSVTALTASAVSAVGAMVPYTGVMCTALEMCVLPVLGFL